MEFMEIFSFSSLALAAGESDCGFATGTYSASGTGPGTLIHSFIHVCRQSVTAKKNGEYLGTVLHACLACNWVFRRSTHLRFSPCV
jgi:hypothetical protein